MEVAFWLATLTFVFFGLILTGLLVFLRRRKNKSHLYLVLFSLFFLYLYKVLDLTRFQYQSLLLLKQLTSGLLAGTTFRIADVNDVLFNTLGVVLGYGLFVGFKAVFRRVFR